MVRAHQASHFSCEMGQKMIQMSDFFLRNTQAKCAKQQQQKKETHFRYNLDTSFCF